MTIKKCKVCGIEFKTRTSTKYCPPHRREQRILREQSNIDYCNQVKEALTPSRILSDETLEK